MEQPLIAYTLAQNDSSWSWRLWDEVGEVIAAGEAPDLLSAEDEVRRALESAQARS
jgi:hypothetical protein